MGPSPPTGRLPVGPPGAGTKLPPKGAGPARVAAVQAYKL